MFLLLEVDTNISVGFTYVGSRPRSLKKSVEFRKNKSVTHNVFKKEKSRKKSACVEHAWKNNSL